MRYVKYFRGAINPHTIDAVVSLFRSQCEGTRSEMSLLRHYIVESIVYHISENVDGGFESPKLNDYFLRVIKNTKKKVVKGIIEDLTHAETDYFKEFSKEVSVISTNDNICFQTFSSIVYEYSIIFGLNSGIKDSVKTLLEMWCVDDWVSDYSYKFDDGGNITLIVSFEPRENER